MTRRCLIFNTMRLPLLFAAAIASGGWALSEARPPRPRPLFSPLRFSRPEPPPPEPPPPEPPRQARVWIPPPRPPLPPVRAEPPPPPRVAVIAGRVVDEDGMPRAGVTVHLDANSVCTELSADDHGLFEVTVAPGVYSVEAFDDRRHESPIAILSVEPGGQARELQIVLPQPPPEESDESRGIIRFDD